MVKEIKEEESEMRCFISIEIPDKIKKQIIQIQNKLPSFKGKITESENLHLTLKFLGEVNEDKINEIRKKLSEIKFKKFEVETDSMGVFSENFIRIIWLHLAGCNKFQEEIDESLLGLFKKEARFMSHLTIARVKNVKNKKKFLDELKKIKIHKMKFVVDKFDFKKSILTKEGPVYSDIDFYRLN